MNDGRAAERRIMQIGVNANEKNYAYYKGSTSPGDIAGCAKSGGGNFAAAISARSSGFNKSSSVSGEEGKETENYLDLIRKRMDEIADKVKKGETEPSFQIGSQSFTEKEWKRLLERFDGTEDAIRAQMKEESARRLKRNAGISNAEHPSSESVPIDKV